MVSYLIPLTIARKGEREGVGEWRSGEWGSGGGKEWRTIISPHPPLSPSPPLPLPPSPHPPLQKPYA
ncbi:hypothetical protein [Tolypothrix sp. VBCCA 56010]|uniref:hypothetical protein n=1 Tax=Tolypothrix sp. VBCCA 56010 TaxID=3137731 RepID=UPI003D7E10F5